MNRRLTSAAAAYTILLLVVVVFNPAFGNGFINFDDPGYITHNKMVQSGFTRASLRWAFTSFDNANWHPLTWLSHMLDTRLFGSLPFGSHLMNVVYHATAGGLLFMLLQRMTGVFWPGFFAAAFFAVHPLRVESVAWAAERKDVLAACFWMLTLLAYLSFARRPGPRRYVLVTVSFALGLMAKPMLVTLPVILLLLDWWPLGRTGGNGPYWLRLGRLGLEKLPLLALSALSAVITFKAQVLGGAVVPLASLSVGERLSNAAAAASTYLLKIAWPTQLSLFYARPSSGIGLLTIAGSVLLLVLATIAALSTRRRRPYLLAGWGWYLIALLPVLGIVQVGYQPRADRYTYLPSVGIAVGLFWWLADITRHRGRVRHLLIGIGAAALLLLAIASQRYLTVWRDGESLFRRALSAGGDTYMMRFCLGGELLKAGKIDAAVTEFTRGLALFPAYPDGHFGMAVALDMRGDTAKAAMHYRRALDLKPGKAETHVFFGSLLERTGSPAAAEYHYREALRWQQDSTFAREGVCRLLAGPRQVVTVPLYPSCGDDFERWESLDKTGTVNYVESANRRPIWAVAEWTGGSL